MKTDLSRREFLRKTAVAGAAAALAPSALGGLKTAEAASTGYSGKLTVFGDDINGPSHGTYKLCKDFEKLHPGVSVEYTAFASQNFVALFTAAQASGQQIDVMQLNGQDLRRYALAGTMLPLDSINYKSRFYTLGLQTYTLNNHLWAVPEGATGGFPIFYNNALFKKAGLAAPKTYADLVHARDALKKLGANVFTHDGGEIYLWPVWFFTTYAQVTGNKSVEKTFATLQGKLKFTDPQVVEALQLIFNFASDKLFAPDVLSLQTASAEAEFFTGKAAMWLHYDGVIADTRTQNPPNMDLKVMLMPQLVKGAVKSQFPGGTGSAVGLYSKIAPERKAIAMQLVDFLTNDANDTWLLADGHSTLGCNLKSQGSTDPVAIAEKALLPDMTIYLDWYWPPEITTAFQQGIQAGITGTQTAKQVAGNIQLVFEGLQARGYKFAH